MNLLQNRSLCFFKSLHARISANPFSLENILKEQENFFTSFFKTRNIVPRTGTKKNERIEMNTLSNKGLRGQDITITVYYIKPELRLDSLINKGLKQNSYERSKLDDWRSIWRFCTYH